MKTVFTVLLTLFSLAGFAQTQSGFPTVITNTALPTQSESFEERLQRESSEPLLSELRRKRKLQSRIHLKLTGYSSNRAANAALFY